MGAARATEAGRGGWRRSIVRRLVVAARFFGAGLATTLFVAVVGTGAYGHDQMTSQWSQPHLSVRLRTPFWSVTRCVTPDAKPDLREAYVLWCQSRAWKFEPGGPGEPWDFSPSSRLWAFIEAGWPRTAFYGWWARDIAPANMFQRRGLLRLQFRLRNAAGQTPRIDLPVLPYWPGLLTNTAIYAGAWWLLAATLRAIRHARRHRRGRCPRCGYDLSGLQPGALCPECGSTGGRVPAGDRDV